METVFIKVDKALLPYAQGYIEHVRKVCSDIVFLASNGGFEDIALLAHRMKGEGGAYGLDEVSAAGREIMNLTEAGDTEGLKSRALSLSLYLDRVKVI
ncbi:hypothetical protein EP073_00890 [Geovibrio thiophilus]|uniref:Hpt domain-containing protein n=1 Tax=Geovibrio thiophilus TaxID=139438 RepID=A0A3R5YXP6_9BACT|nr:hypothetical protein [Geovibrio thiophilus]QAR32007.1 hypothetical protein EP073_00890 [Geovibrio thiophilus]